MRSATLWRGDLIVSVNGQPASASGWQQLVAALPPGSQVTVTYRRSKTPDPAAAVPVPDAAGDLLSTTFSLDAASRWSGTFGGPRRSNAANPEAEEGEFEREIMTRLERVQATAADGGPAALIAALAQLQQQSPDTSELPSIVNAFRRPLSLDAVEKPLRAAAVQAMTADPAAVVGFVNLALDNPMLPDAVLRLPSWFTPLSGVSGYAQALADAQGLVRHHRDSVTVGTGDAALANLAAIRRGAQIEPILSHLSDLLRSSYAAVVAAGTAHAKDAPGVELPPAIRGAVSGDVLFFDPGTGGEGPLVIGGAGPNTYDMSKVARVYDIGGNDIYRYLPGDLFVDQTISGEGGAATVKARVLARVVVDLGGDDVHEASGDFCGPATGVFGVSILDDQGGNDQYRSTGQCAIGAGLVGIGVLIDRGGNDRYENPGPGSGWSIGSGYYGAGIVIDVMGDDTYLGEKLTQGVGGPRGLGAIIDGAGTDLYRANGPSFPSAYGTPGVWLGMSQGFGVGVRGYAQGGIGGIWDLGGDDRYEAGEFSQACGYFWALGILHDSGGHDVYLGNRYSQGSAAHQAAGLLIDENGDDTYWSMTAAGQGAAWDQSIGMLIDRAGNDSYRAGGLSQGSAAQQAIGVLIDLGGADRYSAYAPSQGESGQNQYHYDQWKIFSLSVLLDLAGQVDSYRPGRENGTALLTGQVSAENPAASSAWGVFADE
ncbi:MAG: hypothetical protein GIKADHBN_00750 [Phycisphaerales bacterium]|nr:hypothetical protein [Phycisphaerales bacterium]